MAKATNHSGTHQPRAHKVAVYTPQPSQPNPHSMVFAPQNTRLAQIGTTKGPKGQGSFASRPVVLPACPKGRPPGAGADIVGSRLLHALVGPMNVRGRQPLGRVQPDGLGARSSAPCLHAC